MEGSRLGARRYFDAVLKKEPYRIWDLFTTSPYGPFFLPKKLKKYTKL
jgi:hypothetical protein